MAAEPTVVEPVVRHGLTAQLCLVSVPLFALLPGCATRVRVAPATQTQPASHAAARPASLPWWCDSFDQEIIRRHNLQALMRKNPDRALLKLQSVVSRHPDVAAVAALSDLNCRYAATLQRAQPQKAMGLYLNAAASAYGWIANGKGLTSTNPWNVRMVQSYNKATVSGTMLMQRLPGGLLTNHVVSVGAQPFRVEAQSGDAFSDLRRHDQWLSADDWNQVGLRHRYRNEGLGARLVAIRTNQQETALEVRQPDEGIIHPSTAILRFESAYGESTDARRAILVFYNPMFTPEIEVAGRRWPLAADCTMPWATLLSRTRPLFKTRWTALRHPGETSRPHRLYLMQPYSPDRIPIILVHGLRATPLVWQQLTNELMGDPEIRRRYQIWHYLYPTGLPFLTSAADFRDDVEEVRRLVDPDGRDFATQNMIVIGHSMGGLLAPYSSSHLAGASSEVIVSASHRTYESREAIEEVKRILAQHLVELAQPAGRAPAKQASDSAEGESP